jgi:hypothetical protein
MAMIDLHEGIASLFVEAQLDRAEYLGGPTAGYRFFERGVPCSACGLIDRDHQRYGCRPPALAMVAYGATTTIYERRKQR